MTMLQTSTTHRYMTIKQVAKEYFYGCVTEAALYKLAREGSLPVIRVGKRVLVDLNKMEKQYEV